MTSVSKDFFFPLGGFPLGIGLGLLPHPPPPNCPVINCGCGVDPPQKPPL